MAKAGTFKKGDPRINRKGRPRKPEIQELRNALEKVAEETGIPFWVLFVRMAYKHKEVAIALAKKMLPDKLKGEGFANKSFTQVFEGIPEGDLRGIVENLRKATG